MLGADGVDDGTVATGNPLPISDAGGSLTVDNGGTFAVQAACTNAGTFAVQVSSTTALTPGTAATNLGKAEDAAHSSGDVGVMALGVRLDTAAATSASDGDYQPFITDSTGRLWCNVSNTVTVASHAVTNAGTFVTQVDGSALTALQLIDDIVLTEDAAHSNGDKGVMSLAVRRDADTTLAASDNDYGPLQLNSSGSLKVAITSGAGSGGTSIADEAAFTLAATSHTPVGGVYNATPDTLADGKAGVFQMTAARGQHCHLVDAAGATFAVATAAKQDTIIGHLDGVEGSLNNIDSSTSNLSNQMDELASAVRTEDVAALAGEKGFAVMAVRRDTASTMVGTDNDYTNFIVDASGRLHCNVGNTVTVASHAVTNAGTFAVQAACTNGGTFLVQVDGSALTALQLIDDAVFAEDVAAQAADKGISVLAVRRDTASTMVGADNDYTNLIVDGSGRLHVNVGNAVTVGSHAVTNAGTFATQSVCTNAGTFAVQVSSALPAGTNLVGAVAIQGSTTGGHSFYKSIDLDESEEEVKATAGTVYSIACFNLSTAVIYLKLYNATAANVTVGTTVPVITLPIPTQSATANGAGFIWDIVGGLAFGTAITIAATTGIADNNAGAPGANEVVIALAYK